MPLTKFGEILDVDTTTGVVTLSDNYDSGSSAANPVPPFTGIFGVVVTPEPSHFGSLWADYSFLRLAVNVRTAAPGRPVDFRLFCPVEVRDGAERVSRNLLPPLPR